MCLKNILKQTKKEKALKIILKIELNRANSYLSALLNQKLNDSDMIIPSTDIHELKLSSHIEQLYYFEQKLAEKIFDLGTYLKSANEHRQIAFENVKNQLDDNFRFNNNMFFIECKESKKD